MSLSGRRRSSKWDLKDEQRQSYETARSIPRHEKEDMPLHDRELEQGWFSPEVAGRNRDRWPSIEESDVIRPKHALRESLRGSRSSYESDRIATDVATRHVGDESYIMKTSRDVDDWRQEKRHHSPRNDWIRPHRSRSRSWSRSRSRSPVQNFRRQSGFDDRNRSRSAAHHPMCRDFAAGRCRRGSQCPFLHQDLNHEDDWDNRHRSNGAPRYSASHDSKDYSLKSARSTCIDFLKGNCRRGASCRFAHDSESDGLGKGNEVIRERYSDRRIRSPERDGEREPRKNSDIPCKYFSAGNCRNGQHCRFSHHVQPHPSPEKRLHDDNREQRRNSVNAESMRDGPKWSNLVSSSEKEKSWNGPKWGEKDASSDRGAMNETWSGLKWSGDKDEKLTVSEPRLSGWSDDSGWQHGPDVNRPHGDSRVNIGMVGNGSTDDPNINMHVSEQRIAEESLDDMEMSPDWNFRIETSKNIAKIEHPQLPPSSKALMEASTLTHGQSTTKDTSGQTCDMGLILEPKSTERSYFQQDSSMRDGSAVDVPYSDTNVTANSDINFSSNGVAAQSALTYSSSHAVGQSRLGVLSVLHGGNVDISQSPAVFPEVNLSNSSNIGNTNMSQVSCGIPSQNIVSNEQLTQLSNLTASLAQILGSTQQLPQLSAAVSSHNTLQVPSFSTSGATYGGSTQPDAALAVMVNHVASQQQYDPLSDSIESTKRNLNTTSSGLATIPVEHKYADEQHNRLMSDKGQMFDSHQSDKKNAAASSAHMSENNAAGAREIKNDPEDKNSGPAEYVDGDEKAEESKKNNDSKGIRPFKFALAEFVKDLLKPTWKEGQINKEAYKNIVKKVVDKVTASVQGASIPQTQEKIDQYLSSSKPKLNKLVQAYVEKSQKAK